MKRVFTTISCFVLAICLNKIYAMSTRDSICQGATYTWNAQAYTQSGTYTSGNDTLVLTVNQLPITTFAYVGNACLNNDTISFLYSDSSSLLSAIFNDTTTFWGSVPMDSVPANILPNPFRYNHPTAGKYVVTATSQAGCTYKDSITLVACATSNLYDTICQGDSVFFNSQWQHSAGAHQQQFENSNGIVDSLSILNLTVNMPPQLSIYNNNPTSVCFNPSNFFYNNDSIQVSAYSSTYTDEWSWILNGNVISNDSFLTPITSGTYVVIATNSCGSDTATYILHPCLSDSIWPGDTNHDGIVDNNDLLPIGTANGLSGQARTTTSISWEGFSCNDWGLQLLDGTNVKHADCNGDGHINNDDTLAVVQNFTLTHNKTNDTRSPSRTGIPELKIVFLNDTLSAGDTLVASIQLGSDDSPVENIYGLAFTYNFDQGTLETSSITFEYNSSWLSDDNNCISLSRTIAENGQIKTAVSRTDHNNRSGFGEIAHFKGVVANISGNTHYYTASGYITNSRAINKDQQIVLLNEGIDSVKILESTTGIGYVKNEIEFSLAPNPASNSITISGTEKIEGITLYNVLGEKVYTDINTEKTPKTVDISAFPNGVYIARIQTKKGKGEKRFVVAK